MRYDTEHKAKTHRRLLKEAAKAVRAQGPLKVSVAEVMAKAGLTHGGFYAHFRSKDALIAETIEWMFEDGVRGIRTLVEQKGASAGLAAYIDFYLSDLHRSEAVAGCPIAALAPDLPRLSPEARERFTDGVSRLTGVIADALRAAGRTNPDAEAVSLLSELAGAAQLARAVDDRALSDRILERSKGAITSRLGLESFA